MAPGFIGTFWALKRVLGTVQCVMKGQLPGFALGSSPSSASRVLNWKNRGGGARTLSCTFNESMQVYV